MNNLKKYGRFIARHRILVLIIALILVLPACYNMAITDINYDMLTYLPHNLDSMKGQEILDKKFSNAATSFLIVKNMESQDILKLKTRISKIEGVDKVIWTSDFMDTSIPGDILPDDIKDVFYSKNSTMLIIKFNESASSGVTQKAIGKIRLTSGKQCFLSGMSAIVKDTKDLTDKETPLYVLIAVILSTILLSLVMDSFVTPFLFLAGIGMAVLYNMGTNVFLGNVSYVTKSIAAVLQLGVTMDFSIFLYHRYEEERRKTEDKEEAMAEAIAKTIIPIGGSCLTATAGFLAMCSMRLSLGYDIGIVMAKGVILGFLSVITILPSLILVFDKLRIKTSHRVIMPKFEKTANFVTKHYKLMILIFALAFIPAIYGKQNTEVYYNLDRSLPQDLPSITATNKLRKDYNMTTTHFIVINKNLENYKIKKMTDEINEVQGINKVICLDRYIGPSIPESFIPEDIREAFEKDKYKLILVNSSYKAASEKLSTQLKEINKITKSYDKSSVITGEGALTKDLTEIADKDFVTVDIVSIGAILAIIAVLYVSLSVPLILVISIELAIFINMSIPFYTGSVIPFVASIVIGCIQLGSCVNYAILMTTRFREELFRHEDKYEAMKVTVKESSRSVAASALSFFAATIGVSFISELEMIKSLCTMMARGALISMVVIIFVLPCLLLVFEKPISLTTKNWRKKSNKTHLAEGRSL